MAPRVPTIIGWVGFDGGYRRAISFARSLVRKEPDDDPILKPPAPCDYGPELLVTIGTFTICGCAADAFRSYKVLSDTVAPGVYSAPTTAGNLGPWEANVGEAEMQTYADSDFDCLTPAGVPSHPAVLVAISCVDDIITVTGRITDGVQPIFFATGAIGDTLTNTLDCTNRMAVIDFITVEAA